MRDVGHKITETCNPEEVTFVNQEIEKIENGWKDLNTTAKKRKESIEDNYEMSSQFFDGSKKLNDTFAEVTTKIKADQTVGKDKSMVRVQIKKHKV